MATPRSSQSVCGSNKHQGATSKVVILESPIAIDSGESEWGGIDLEWESGDFDKWLGVEDTIVVQPVAQTLRSTTRVRPHRCSLVYLFWQYLDAFRAPKAPNSTPTCFWAVFPWWAVTSLLTLRLP